ncbi:MAG: flagellar biosynthetic protein FliR [Pirellulales bacterium]
MAETWSGLMGVAVPLAIRWLAFLLSSAVLAPCGANWRLRVAAALVLSSLLAVSVGEQLAPVHSAAMVWSPVLLVREIILGLSLGLTSTLVMEAFRIAGDLLLIGLVGERTVGWDEQAGSPWSHVVTGIGWCMLFLSGSHCTVIDHAISWCRMYPPGEETIAWQSLEASVQVVGTMFALAWGIAMPLLLSQWAAQVGMAALARIVPVWVHWTSLSLVPICVVWLVMGCACAYWTSVGWERVASQLNLILPTDLASDGETADGADRSAVKSESDALGVVDTSMFREMPRVGRR